MRRRLDETLDPAAAKTKGAAHILSTVLGASWTRVLIGLALICGGTITQYFLIAMTPYAIRTLHLPASTAMLGSVTLGLAGGLGALAGGAMADRWGIKAVALAPRALFMVALFPVMSHLVAHPNAATLVAAVATLSLLQAMSGAVGVVLIPLIFPPAVRSTGLALTYSLGVAIFGGTATYVITWLVGVPVSVGRKLNLRSRPSCDIPS